MYKIGAGSFGPIYLVEHRPYPGSKGYYAMKIIDANKHSHIIKKEKFIEQI